MPVTWIKPTGQTTRRPGVYSDIDASALASSGPVARGTVALVLSEPSLAPLTVYSATSAGAFKRLVPDPQGTPLAKCLFNPSTDPRIPSGATKGLIVNVSPSTRASLTKAGVSGGNALKINFAKYGAAGNDCQVKLEDGTVATTRKVTATRGTLTETKDNIAVVTDVLGFTYTESLSANASNLTTSVKVDPLGASGAASNAGVVVSQTIRVAEAQAWTLAAGESVAFDGKITVTTADAQTMDVCTIVGVSKTTGLPVTEVVAFVAQTTKETTNAFSAVTSVTVGNLTTSTYVTLSWNAFDLVRATYDTIAKVAAKIATKSANGFACSVKIGETSLPVASMDGAGPTLLVSAAETTFDAGLYYLIAAINANFSLITAERVTATGISVPANFTLANLTGGADGVAQASDWEAAFAKLVTEQCAVVVPLTTDPAIHALLDTHLAVIAGQGRSRMGVVGLPLSSDKPDIQSAIVALNYRNTVVAIDGIDLYDYTGTQTTYGPEYFALMAAAADQGRKSNVSLTWCLLDVLDVVENPSDGTVADRWTSQDDAEDLLSYGALFLSKSPRGGWRIESDITSYLTDDNPCFSNWSSNQSANFCVENVKNSVETFVGAHDATEPDVIENVATELQRQKDNGEITDFTRRSIAVDEPTANGFDVDFNVKPLFAKKFFNLTAHVVASV